MLGVCFEGRRQTLEEKEVNNVHHSCSDHPPKLSIIPDPSPVYMMRSRQIQFGRTHQGHTGRTRSHMAPGLRIDTDSSNYPL